MKLRARWLGPPPRVGDYLMVQTRPRFAYRIERVTSAFPNVGWDATAKAEAHLLQFVVDRVAASALPDRAKVHPWTWDRREGRAKGLAR
jgi:hypothetical protein